jgi:hypothetical protein
VGQRPGADVGDDGEPVRTVDAVDADDVVPADVRTDEG